VTIHGLKAVGTDTACPPRPLIATTCRRLIKGAPMHLTDREWWAVIHGMGLGALFLLSFAGGLAEFFSLKSAELTQEGILQRTRRLKIGTWLMAVVAWLTVFTGTWIVYPWYRDAAAGSPRSLLLANPSTADWHEFGMEWKEHIAWIAPILATAVAFTVSYYGSSLINHQGVRKALLAFFAASFVIAGIAGALGAFITKVAPVH
jgi:hypothetical protein